MKKFRWQHKKEIAQESQNQDESLQKQLDQMEAQRNAFQEEVQRLSAELKEVEGHRALFLAQREEAEENLKHCKAELAEVERQRDVFVEQRDVLQQEVTRLYQGHTDLENEINFLKYRIETLDALHERVVQRHWAKETDPATKYTCAYPFDRIEILPDGAVYSCCSAYLKHGFSFGNIFSQDMEQIWNSDHAKKLRYSVSCGAFEYCQDNCLQFMSREAELYPVMPREGKSAQFASSHDCTMQRMPKYITLSCDESCNLHCKSCREHVKMMSAEESEKLTRILMEKVRPLLGQCEQLSLLGSGEFLVSKATSVLLKSLSHQEFPQLKLDILTNGQLFTKERWETYSNLNGMPLTIRVSIDGATKETYESLRRGGKWETICQNMEYLGNAKKHGQIQSLGIHFVMQRNNFREAEALVGLAKRWHADFIRFLALANWGTFSAEEYCRENVFDPKNEEYAEASALLRRICTQTKDLKIYQNIMNLQ